MQQPSTSDPFESRPAAAARPRVLSNCSRMHAIIEDEDPLWGFQMSGVMVLEGPVKKGELAALLRARVTCFQRYRSVVERSRGLLNDKYILKDLGEDYDAERNIREVDRPMQTMSDIAAYGEEVLQRPFEDGIPPWEMHLVHNFQGSKTCLIARFSHVLGDGFTVVQLLLALTDKDTTHRAIDPAVARENSLEKRAPSVVERCWRLLRNTPYMLYVLSGLSLLFEDQSLLRGSKVGKKASVSFAQPISITQLKQVVRPMGATVNDALLAIISGATRRYLLAQGADVPRNVTTLITFNTRTAKLGNAELHESSFGNRSVPLLISTSMDPSAQVRILHAKSCMDRLKCSPIMVFASLIHSVLSVLLNFVMLRRLFNLWLLVRDWFGTTLPFPTLVLTNVPGPTQPLLMLGLRLEVIQAFVSLPNTFAAFSYNGQLRIWYTADKENIDAKLMSRCIDEEAAEMLKKAS